MRERAITIVSAWLGLLVASACAHVQEVPRMGGAIATAFDTTNGRPAVVLDQPWESSDSPAGRDSASAVASGFAAALGIPVIEGDEVDSPRCPWAPPPGDMPLGLWALFSPPVARGDSVQIHLATGCVTDAEGAFEQLEVFLLLRARDGSWRVVAQRLLRIT